MRKRVVVTGLGCVSPVGNSVEETWECAAGWKVWRCGHYPIRCQSA